MRRNFINDRSLFILFALFCGVLTLMGCNHTAITATHPATSKPTRTPTIVPSPCVENLQEIIFDTISLERSFSGFEDTAIYIIANLGDLEEIDTYIQNDEIYQDLKDLDYNKEFAILVSRGQNPSTGYEVFINHVLISETTVSLCATFVFPQPNDVVSDILTNPYHLIRLNKSDIPLGQSLEFRLIANGELLLTATHSLP